jgi:NadR type nicotinamide-nucleotide adenylyltransferase
MIKKIVAIGPESTGKSTLCKQLASHYQTHYVDEYAREYLLKNGTAYTYDNLLEIAKGQLSDEDSAVSRMVAASQQQTINKQLVFIDTDMYVMKVWCEFVFNRCHHWILNRIAERDYTLYLLCNVDLPWVKDELREYPDLESRKKLFCFYKDILVNQHVPWVEISGNNDERLQKAISAVEKLL